MKQRIVVLLRHAHVLVKDLPGEEALTLSLLRGSLRLRRLDLQERALENLGVFLPVAVTAAWVEQVEVTLGPGMRLRVQAQRLCVRAQVREQHRWQEEMSGLREAAQKAKERALREHEAAAVGLEALAAAPLLAGALRQALLELEICVQDVQLVLRDASAPHWEPVMLSAAASSVSLLEPLRLAALLDPGVQVCRTSLRLEGAGLFCTRPRRAVAAAYSSSMASNHSYRVGRDPEEDGWLDLTDQALLRQDREDSHLEGGTAFDPACALLNPGILCELVVEICKPAWVTSKTQSADDLCKQPPRILASINILDQQPCIRVSQAQLGYLMRLGATWDLWEAFVRQALQAVLTKEESRAYQSVWLAAATAAAAAGTWDASRDTRLTEFEARHSLQQVLRQRRIAMARLAARGDVSPCPRDPAHRTELLIALHFGPCTLELCAEDASHRVCRSPSGIGMDAAGGCDAREPAAVAALRVRLLGDLGARGNCCVLQMNNDPHRAPAVLRVSLGSFAVEVQEAEGFAHILLEHHGVLQAELDIHEHADMALCTLPPRRCSELRVGSMLARLDPEVILAAADLAFGALHMEELDVEPACELAVNVAPELEVHLPSGARAQEARLLPQPGSVAWDVQVISEGFVSLYLAGSGDTALAVRFRLARGHPHGTHVEAPCLAIRDISASAVPAHAVGFLGTACNRDMHAPDCPNAGNLELRLTCEEIGMELSQHEVLVAAAPMVLLLPPAGLALLMDIAHRWCCAAEMLGAWGAGWWAVLREAAGASVPAVGPPAVGARGEDATGAAEAAGAGAAGAWTLRLEVKLASVELQLGGTQTAAVLRLHGQSLELRALEGLRGASLAYRLGHGSASEGAGRLHVLHCGRPGASGDRGTPCALTASVALQRHLDRGAPAPRAGAARGGAASPEAEYLAFGFERWAGGEEQRRSEGTGRLDVGPLWVCLHWPTASAVLRYVEDVVSAARPQRSSRCEGAGERAARCRHSSSSPAPGLLAAGGSAGELRPLAEASRALDSLSFRACLQRIAVFVPCTGSQGLLLSLRAQASATKARSQVLVSDFCAAEAAAPAGCAYSDFLLPRGPAGEADSAQVLHPVRLRAVLTLALGATGRPCVSGRLGIDPLRVSVRTAHLPLVLGLHSSVSGLLRRESERGSGGELFAQGLQGALRAATTAARSCSWDLEAQLRAIRIGLVHSSSDVELCVALLEDASLGLVHMPPMELFLGGASDVPSPSQGHARSVPTVPAGDLAEPARDMGLSLAAGHGRRHLELCGEVAAISLDVTCMDTVKLAPLLEPVHMGFARGACRSRPAVLALSWVNFNASTGLADTFVCLMQELREVRARGQAAPCEEHSAWELQRTAGTSDNLEPHNTCARAVTSLAPVLLGKELGQFGAKAIEKGHGPLPCAVKIPDIAVPCQPQVTFYNDLGQPVDILLRLASVEETVADGQTLTVAVPWHMPVGVEEHPLWEAEVVLKLATRVSVTLHLTATPRVQAVPVRMSSGSSSMHAMLMTASTDSLASSVAPPWPNCLLRGSRRGVDPDESQVLPQECCWMLVRREIKGTLHRLEVKLSSVVFLENRSSVAMAVGPLGRLEEWVELPPGCAPRPIPLTWCLGTSSPPPLLWCGLASAVKLNTFNVQTAQRLKLCGLVQPLLGRGAWRSIWRYRSMAAEDYFMRSRELLLRDSLGESVAHVCATVYGVSTDLQASLQALFFSVAIEPMVQICNRLSCGLHLRPGGELVAPGEDAELLRPWEPLRLEIDAADGLLRVAEPVVADRIRKERHQRRLAFRALCGDAAVHSAPAPCSPAGPALWVTMGTEPGLPLPERWKPLQVHQYSHKARRLVIFTQYWLANRRSDCRIMVPQGLHPAGAVRLPERERRASFGHVGCNALRMLSEDLVHGGRVQIALCDQYYNANDKCLVPVTNAFRVDQPTRGSATAPRSKANPVQRCFGYVVRPAPFPFYRTSIIEVLRLFTLLNHKEHELFCQERHQPGPALRLAAGASAAFDPRSQDLELSITGARSRPSSAETAETAASSACAAEKDGRSAFFGLSVQGASNHFQLLHQVETSTAGPSTVLVQPEPLEGSAERCAGRAWCLTAVDIHMAQNSVVVRFADPPRPDFRIVNRTGHAVQLWQEGEPWPRLDLPAEQRISFAWFRPQGQKRLRVCLPGGENRSFEIGAVGRHPEVLQFEHPPCGRAQEVWRESFYACTRVHRGSREVHIHPWCRITNRTTEALVVRSASMPGSEAPVPQGGGSVCLQPDAGSKALLLQVRGCGRPTDGANEPHWSREIRVSGALAGSRGYLRHMLGGGGPGEEAVFQITTVEVYRDRVSDFLHVELKPYMEAACPYLLENSSGFECLVRQVCYDGIAEHVDARLPPGGRLHFVPLGLGCSSVSKQAPCSVRLRTATQAQGGLGADIVIDIEKPQRVPCDPLYVEVLKERPRRVLIQDAEAAAESLRRRSLREHAAALPAVLVARQLLGAQGAKKARRWLARATLEPLGLPGVPGGRTAPGGYDNDPGPGAAPREALGSPSTCSTSGRQAAGGAEARGDGRVSRLAASMMARPLALPLAKALPLPRLPQMPPAEAKFSPQPRARPLRSPPSGGRASPSPLGVVSGRSGRSSPSAAASTRSRQRTGRRLRLEGCGDVFWQRQDSFVGEQGVCRSEAVLHIEGLGVALIDSVSLQEVAYVSVEKLRLGVAEYEGLDRGFRLALGSLQVDVQECTRWKRSVMLQPWRGHRLRPTKAVDERREAPVAELRVRWRALDPEAGAAAHLEVDSLELEVRSLEARLDTSNCFRLAHWALELGGRVAPAVPALQPLFQEFQGRCTRELLCRQREGCPEHPQLGESQFFSPEDFAVPTPVFLKRVLLRRMELVLSVRFGGTRVSDCQGNEALQALDYVLRRMLPFDVSQARITLGSSAPRCLPWGMNWVLPCGRTPRDACLEDKFMPNGLAELFRDALREGGTAVLRQVPQLLGSQRLLGSPLHLFAELSQSALLAWLGVSTCDPGAFLAALLVAAAALVESVEGICTIVAKTACRLAMHAVPSGLRQEPSGWQGALMDLLWYGFPWHFRQAYRECQRLINIARSSQSCTLAACCVFRGLCYWAAALGCAMLLVTAKVLQALHLLARASARQLCPGRVAELSVPTACRAGGALFRLNSLLQYSERSTAALSAVHWHSRGTRHRDWRLRALPGGEGLLVAVRDGGFFLARPGEGVPPGHSAGLLWSAPGSSWEAAELRRGAGAGGCGGASWELRLLRRPGPSSGAEAALPLRSSEAALAAFGFVEECLASWACAAAPASTAPEVTRWPLLQRVRRSASARAAG